MNKFLEFILYYILGANITALLLVIADLARKKKIDFAGNLFTSAVWVFFWGFCLVSILKDILKLICRSCKRVYRFFIK